MVLDLLCFCIKQNRDCGSLIQFAFHSDLAMMILYGVLHDGQAKAGAAGLFGMTLIYTIEALKYLVLMFGSNTNAGIADADLYSVLLLCNGHLHFATWIVVLNGIVAEIVNDLV